MGLPVFEMVKNFCLLFSSLNPMVLKIGKSVLEVGKMLFLLYTEETSEVFIPSVVYYSIQYHLSGFFLFKLISSANSIRLWISFSVGSCFLISSNLILSIRGNIHRCLDSLKCLLYLSLILSTFRLMEMKNRREDSVVPSLRLPSSYPFPICRSKGSNRIERQLKILPYPSCFHMILNFTSFIIPSSF